MTYQEGFLDYLKFEKRFSENTFVAYKTDLEQFSAFIKQNGGIDNPSEVNYRLIRRWIVLLIEQGISSRSVNRKLTTLKTFFKYLQRQGFVQSNPLDKVIAPKVAKRLPVFVEEKQMDTLLDDVEFDEGFTGTRNRLIIETFYLTGIRLSELLNLKEADIDKYNKSIKVLGKRNKERIIPVNPEFLKSIDDFLELKRRETLNMGEYLFTNQKGTKLYPNAVYRIIKAYLRLVTSVEKKSPHVLRHSFATHLLNHGADLNAIKELLGHANLSATQVYTHNTFEKLTKIYKQAHPRA